MASTAVCVGGFLPALKVCRLSLNTVKVLKEANSLNDKKIDHHMGNGIESLNNMFSLV